MKPQRHMAGHDIKTLTETFIDLSIFERLLNIPRPAKCNVDQGYIEGISQVTLTAGTVRR